MGATGAVGGTLLAVLAERGLPLAEVRCLASPRSAGQRVRFGDTALDVQVAAPGAFQGLDICFLAVPGAQASRTLAPWALAAGAQVIDKGSAFRLDPEVPLVVPEVNPEAAIPARRLMASPNCTTIPLVLCLAPLARAGGGLRRVIISTYQAASGAGHRGLAELEAGIRGERPPEAPSGAAFPRQLAFNVVPQCDAFGTAGYTLEEWKLVHETRKILAQPTLAISATAVRVPVRVGHAESVYVETERPLGVEVARAALAAAPGVVVRDDPDQGAYPTPLDVAGTDQAHVGRIRADLDFPNGLHLWIVGDNLRKGAATNAVQIAELLMRR